MIDEKKLIDELENLKAKTIIFKSDLTFNNAIDTAIDTVNDQPKVGEWIPVEKGLPEEKERIESVSSDLVLVTVKGCNENEYYVTTDYTVDGEWNIEMTTGFYKVTAWMPLPQRYEKELENELL